MKALSQDEILTVSQGSKRQSAGPGHDSDVDMKNGEITIRRLKGSLKTTHTLADLQGQPVLP